MKIRIEGTRLSVKIAQAVVLAAANCMAFAAGGAAAQDFDGRKTAQSETRFDGHDAPAPPQAVATPVSSRDHQDPEIAAVAKNSDKFPFPGFNIDKEIYTFHPRVVLDKSEGKVDGIISVCKQPMPERDADDNIIAAIPPAKEECKNVEFVFPQLRVDRTRLVVAYYNPAASQDEVVAVLAQAAEKNCDSGNPGCDVALVEFAPFNYRYFVNYGPAPKSLPAWRMTFSLRKELWSDFEKRRDLWKD